MVSGVTCSFNGYFSFCFIWLSYGFWKMVGHWNSADVFLLPGRVPCLFSFRGRCVFWRNYPNSFFMGKFLAWAFLLFYSEHLVVGISFYDIIVPRRKVSVHSFLPHCHSFKTYRLLVVNCWCSFWGFPPSIPVGWGRYGLLGRPVVGAVLRFPLLLFLLSLPWGEVYILDNVYIIGANCMHR
jgi:hypothetical protein